MEAKLLHGQASQPKAYHQEISNHGSEDALLPGGHNRVVALCLNVGTPSREEEEQLEDELSVQGPVLGTGIGLDSTIDLDDIEMTPSMQGGMSQPRILVGDVDGPSISLELSTALQTIAASSKEWAELDAKIFEICSSKRSKGEGSNNGSDASYSSVVQCMKFLQDITHPLPMHVHLRATKAFVDLISLSSRT